MALLYYAPETHSNAVQKSRPALKIRAGLHQCTGGAVVPPCRKESPYFGAVRYRRALILKYRYRS